MKFIFILISILSFSQCGDDAPDERTGGNGTTNTGSGNSSATSFKGPWSGFIYQRQNGITLQDRSFVGNAEFKDDETFVITVGGSEIFATGNYQNLDSSKELYLNIEKSNTSLVGDAGKKVKYAWMRNGNELNLVSGHAEFKLARPAGYKEPKSNEDDATKGPVTMNGKWACQELNDGLKWNLEIGGEKDFAAVRYSGNSPGIRFSGSITKDVSATQALMTIQQAAETSAIGLTFRLTVVDAKSLKIGKLNRGETSSSLEREAFPCARK